MMTLITVFLSIQVVVFEVKIADATIDIYIRADGSIEPSYAPMQRDGDLYILTDNISSIVIERNNMTLDGAHLTVQGSQNSGSEGIYIYRRSNVTIKNMNVKGFYHGIWLDSSSNSSIISSSIQANRGKGIVLSAGSEHNSIVENNITANGEEGIFLLEFSNYNSIVDNNITANNCGISLYLSLGNVVSGNNILSNNCGIRLQTCSNNFIYHNNFVSKTNQVYAVESTNIWDNGYPSGGNYWSDYAGTDSHGGFSQNLIGGDDIGDLPYPIDMNNWDRFPLMTEYILVISEFSPFLILPLLFAVTLSTVIVYRTNRGLCK
jgi:parallel beta-helix repeat protein